MRRRVAVRAQISFLIRLYRQNPVSQNFRKPAPPSAAPARAQRELRVPLYPGRRPRRGIAKTLAAILPPAARTPGGVLRAQGLLPPLRAPPQFPARPCLDFGPHQILIAEPRGITQPQPDEVRHLVDENPRKLRPRTIERDPPFAQKRPRMHRPAPVPQPAHHIYPHRQTRKRWHLSLIHISEPTRL